MLKYDENVEYHADTQTLIGGLVQIKDTFPRNNEDFY